jgi:hypothetical protein
MIAFDSPSISNAVILSGAKDPTYGPGSRNESRVLQAAIVRFLASLGMTF